VQAESADHFKAALERISRARPWVKGEVAPGAIQSADLELVWSQTFVETFAFAGAPAAWTGGERDMARSLFRRWNVKRDGSKPYGEFADFLIWAIANWGQIMARDFGWMTKNPPPKFPSVRFLAGNSAKFEEAWLNRKRKSLLQSWDLSYYERLRVQGYSEDAAIEMVARRKFEHLKRTEAAKRPRKPMLALARENARDREPAPSTGPVARDSGALGGEAQPANATRRLIMENGRAAAAAIFDAPLTGNA
jgi:hypothetical protein